MPEMPEVEQVRKTLLPHIKGKTIKNIEINLARLIKYPSPEEFIAGLTGKTILDVGRRGKYLVLKTGENQKLIVHLRMTGSLIAQDADKPEPPYAKIKFELTDGVTMWFCDIRTFGTLYLVTNNDAYIEGYETLGPEPLSEGFTADYMRSGRSRWRRISTQPIFTLPHADANAPSSRTSSTRASSPGSATSTPTSAWRYPAFCRCARPTR